MITTFATRLTTNAGARPSQAAVCELRLAINEPIHVLLSYTLLTCMKLQLSNGCACSLASANTNLSSDLSSLFAMAFTILTDSTITLPCAHCVAKRTPFQHTHVLPLHEHLHISTKLAML